MRRLAKKILCLIGLHSWGSPQDDFPWIPSEADCARILHDRTWPNYPYQRCAHCAARRSLPKTYVPMRRSP
jgi:hypothetical protein